MNLRNRNQVLIIICVCLLSCINGCSQSKQNSTKTSGDNPLLADKVKAHYQVDQINHIINKPGVGKYNLEPFLSELFNKTYSNEIAVIAYWGDTMSIEAINAELEKMNTADLKEFFPSNSKEITTHLAFEEEWDFDIDKQSFKKSLIQYNPVRLWFEGENGFAKRIFVIANKAEGNFNNLIAEDIIHQFPLYKPFNITGLDMKKFCEYLTENVINGKIKAYDPTFLVNLQKRELSKQDIENISKIESVCEGAQILIFHEDWFYDSNTMSIQKKVKGIALSGHFDIDGKYEKKTLFYIPLNY